MGPITSCLANNIRTLRERKKLTQAQLAKKAQISLVFLQGIESRRKWISPQTVSAIAGALQVPESKLFHEHISVNSKKIQRLAKVDFDHLPDDVFNALATTCKSEAWKWEAVRWLLQGFEAEHIK